MMGVEPVEDLRGSLAFTALVDVLQFLNTTARTGELRVEGGPDRLAAQIFFENGTIYDAREGSTTGIDAIAAIMSWVEGTFVFTADKMTPTVTVEVNLQNALVEAARRFDERQRKIAERDSRQAPQRLLGAFAESSGVVAVMLMGRDGSLIASADPQEAVRMEELGVGLKALIETVDELGRNQNCRPFGGFFIEYDRFQLVCVPVAGAILVVVAPGRAQLGVIRHKTQHLADTLADVLPI